jgi:hypothetical protein
VVEAGRMAAPWLGKLARLNDDVIDLYDRKHIGTKVVVLPMSHMATAGLSRALHYGCLEPLLVQASARRRST